MNGESQQHTSLAYPSIKQMFVLLLIFLGFQIAAALLILVTLSFLFKIDVNHPVQFFIIYIVTMVLTIGYAWLRKLKIEGKVRWPMQKVPLVIFPLLFIVSIATIILTDPLVSLIPMPEFVYRLFFEKLTEKSIFTWGLVVIIGPVLEEVLFRGLILDGFLKRYSARKAIVWSSIFFGIYHLNPWQFISAFCLGLLLGWVFVKTRSLVSAIFIHFSVNLFSYVTVLYIAGRNEDIFLDDQFYGGTGYFILALAASLLALIVILPLLNKILSCDS
jgi:membrane protease YdiL (CAAX protease family)